MTADPVTAPAATLIGELARMMLDAHIHRVIVVDTQRRPVGVVSATDLLAAIAQADAARHLADNPAAAAECRRAPEACNR
jgi:CBS domain-containing protein